MEQATIGGVTILILVALELIALLVFGIFYPPGHFTNGNQKKWVDHRAHEEAEAKKEKKED